MECAQTGCSRARTQNVKHFCDPHWREHKGVRCSIGGCSDFVRSNGLCNIHYTRNRTHGSATATVRPVRKALQTLPGGLCANGCGKKAVQRGQCRSHAQEELRGHCRVDGCPSIAYTVKTSLCKLHSERLQANGSVGPVGRIKMPHGVPVPFRKGQYLAITAGKGVHILQHRAVMEAHLGRALHEWETIHHINGITTDNRLENLELWVRRQPSGQRIEDLLDWAREVFTEEKLDPPTTSEAPVVVRPLSLPPRFRAKTSHGHKYEHQILALASGGATYDLSKATGSIARGKGYMYVSRNALNVPVHRLVYAAFLGRPLEPHENVHHINGIRDDNRIENLELWLTFQPTGVRAVDMARSLLSAY